MSVLIKTGSNILGTNSVLSGPKPSNTLAPTALSQPKPIEPVNEDDLRSLVDPVKTRAAIYDRVLDAAIKAPPVSNKRHTLRLSNVRYVDPDYYDLAAQKKAIISNQTLGRRMAGTWELLDNESGNVLASKNSTIARVPFMTDRGTFINKGVEYTLSNQLRMKPGVYTRVKENGEIEAHANVLPGQGVSHRYFLDPAKGVFYMRLQQANIPLVPVLRSMGVGDQELKEAWGDELYRRNIAQDKPGLINKLYERLVGSRGKATDEYGQRQEIGEAMQKMRVDPMVMKRTLGLDTDHLSLGTILATTKKLLAISRQEQDVDDRDHLAFQSIMTPEDLFAERIARDAAGLRRQLLYKSSFKGSLDHLPTGALTKQVEAALLSSGLGQPIEETNLAEVLDKMSRITKMGEGGLGSLDAVPDESRAVQPSHYLAIDPVRTPESSRIGIDTYLSHVLKKDKNGRVQIPLINFRDGSKLYRSPEDLLDSTIGFNGEFRPEDPPEKVGYAMRGGKMMPVQKKDVDYIPSSFRNAFSPLANFIPFVPNAKAQRMAMGSRMTTQALSLLKPEAPFVQTGDPDNEGKSYEEHYGETLGAIRAKTGGVVTKVTPDGLTIRGDDGKTQTIPMYNNFVLNRKTGLHNTPLVQVGARIEPGQLLAKSNMTDDNGTAALGVNARVGYLAYKGYDFEDALVISESFAKNRLKSEHMYQNTVDLDDTKKTKLRDFVSLFPSRFDRKTLANMDEDGVVKPGTTVQYGDPLILMAGHRNDTYGKIHRKGKPVYADQTQTWDHGSEGVVTDVFKSDKGINVIVKSTNTTNVGDKLSFRYGDKSVISAIVPDDKMPRGEDGLPLEVLTNPLGTISRGNPSQQAEAILGKIAAKTGKPYKMPDFTNDSDLIEWVMKEAQKHGVKDLETVIDPDTGRGIKDVFVGNRFVMKLAHMAEDKLQGRAFGGYSQDGIPAKGGPEGCFIGEQRITTIKGRMRISQICEKKLGIPVLTFSETLQDWVYRPITNWFKYSAPVGNILAIDVSGPVVEIKSKMANSTRHTMYPTKNHQVLMFDGSRKLAGELKVGDQLVSWGTNWSQLQLEAALGTLLGDAYCNQYALTMKHSIKQVKYVDWKASLFAGLNPHWCDVDVPESEIRNSFRGSSSKCRAAKARQITVSGRHLAEPLQELCYTGPNGEKVVTDAWLSKIGGLGVSLWVLDDGTIGSKGFVETSTQEPGSLECEKLTGSLCTQGFGRLSVERVRDWFIARYGETCSIGADNRINFPTKILRKIVREIAEWVPWDVIPKSKGTLVRLVKAIQAVTPPRDVRTVNKLEKIPARILDIRPWKPRSSDIKTVPVYDFTVDDTHTYCAGVCLVSNSKQVGLLQVNALLSHGATNTLRDASTIRGQKNEDYWLAFMQGVTPPQPHVPKVYEKFIHQLRAAGINVAENGTQTNIMAMTDKDIDKLAGTRFVESGDTLDLNREMRPIKGGLFDESLTGGSEGNRWSAIKLHEPMPNPVMEEPIRRLLGLTKNAFESVIAGKTKLPNGQTGTAGIAAALKAINLDQALAQTRMDMEASSKTKRDAAIRKLGYLKSAKRLGIHPSDWMLTKAPVLPPKFRPVSLMQGSGVPLVSDANYLYKELIDSNNNLKELSELSDDVGDERLATYNAFKAVTGLGDPIQPKLQEKRVRGVLQHIFGGSPKSGTVQRRLIGSAVDMVGRAVITPDPELDMDQVGIPEERAWSIYKPFIVRRLRRRGMPFGRALQAVEDRDKLAKNEMLEEMKSRPVLIDRAPVWHKFGVLAFYPKLTTGDTMRISPLVVKGFNADFDGDAMQYHVQADDAAVAEAKEKLLPSKNLFSPADFKSPAFQPGQEYTGGLYAASTKVNNKPVRTFRSLQDAIAAFERGDLSADDRISVLQ